MYPHSVFIFMPSRSIGWSAEKSFPSITAILACGSASTPASPIISFIPFKSLKSVLHVAK